MVNFLNEKKEFDILRISLNMRTKILKNLQWLMLLRLFFIRIVDISMLILLYLIKYV